MRSTFKSPGCRSCFKICDYCAADPNKAASYRFFRQGDAPEPVKEERMRKEVLPRPAGERR